MDQPITALSLFKQGLDHFPGEVTLLTGIARIHEVQYAIIISNIVSFLFNCIVEYHITTPYQAL